MLAAMAAASSSPAVILLAVAAGGSLFGIPGAYLAVPVTAVVVPSTAR